MWKAPPDADTSAMAFRMAGAKLVGPDSCTWGASSLYRNSTSSKPRAGRPLSKKSKICGLGG